MKISVIHPSKGRPEMAIKTIEKWLEYADGDIEYLLSLDNEDANWYIGFTQQLYMEGKIKYIFNKTTTAISAINEAAKHATGDLFVVISDDFICPKHWNTKLIQRIQYDWDTQIFLGRKDFLVKTKDGLQPTLITLPILDRTYYNRFGYIYHPDYLHMFSDQEMTAVGHMLGRVINVDMTFEHWHYSTGKSPKDEVNVRNDMTWKQGQLLFDRHLQNNFGIENPVMAYSDIKWK